MTITEVEPTELTEPSPDIAFVADPNPFIGSAKTPRAGSKLFGAFSIENFCSAGALSQTHEDAAGFLDYVRQFDPPNFWYQDSGVKIWAYYEDYDNWQDTYGMDAVRTAWHSGHGGMDANGVFYVPMGAAWAGDDCTAVSTNMRLGNETARYIMWSTCESLRVHDGHSPARTWGAANQGLRMIFGFETVSWDDPNYGRNFWNHWRNNESLGTAWLNGSWDIAHDQAPSVVACGATADEARDRVFNERFLSGDRASTAWYWWRWYDAARSATRELNRSVPDDPKLALLAPVSRSTRSLSDVFDVPLTNATRDSRVTSFADGDRRVSVSSSGLVTAHLATPNRDNPRELTRRAAGSAAGQAVRRFNLDADSPLILDRIVAMREAGSKEDGSEAVAPRTTQTMVQYRQIIDGVPVITPGAGVIRVFLDNDGSVTTVQSNTRSVDELTNRAQSTTGEPSAPSRSGNRRQPEPEAALAAALTERLRVLTIRGTAPTGYHLVPGSTEVGYEIREGAAALIARQAVELEFGPRFRKRYWLQAPVYQ
jgi:hypothetical protein